MKEKRNVICLKDDRKKTAKMEFEIVEGGVRIGLAPDLFIEKRGRNYFALQRMLQMCISIGYDIEYGNRKRSILLNDGKAG